MVVDTLYYNNGEEVFHPNEGLGEAFSFSNDILKQALKHIYSKKFHPLSDIEENLFDAFWATYNLAADRGMADATAPDPSKDFRAALRHNNAVFAAFKVHRMQNDMAAMLRDENGDLKPFEQWVKDVRPIASHQCERWLRTEYDTAVTRAHQAADWQQFEREKDVLPNLRWMPSTSPHPGVDHKIFWNIVRPIDDPFWNEHRPGDRWNCKCSLSSTDDPETPLPNISAEPETPVGTSPHAGLDGNPGIDAKLFSDSHPYIANAYKGAEKAVEKFIRKREERKKTEKDKDFGQRLQISKAADKTELKENKRAAKALLSSFPDMNVAIRPHVLAYQQKNPEYEIDGLIADRKGIESEKGIASAFKKAIRQGCKVVVIDLDMNMRHMNVKRLAGHIWWRHKDFKDGRVKDCYVVFGGKAVRIDGRLDSKEKIIEELQKIKP